MVFDTPKRASCHQSFSSDGIANDKANRNSFEALSGDEDDEDLNSDANAKKPSSSSSSSSSVGSSSSSSSTFLSSSDEGNTDIDANSNGAPKASNHKDLKGKRNWMNDNHESIKGAPADDAKMSTNAHTSSKKLFKDTSTNGASTTANNKTKAKKTPEQGARPKQNNPCSYTENHRDVADTRKASNKKNSNHKATNNTSDSNNKTNSNTNRSSITTDCNTNSDKSRTNPADNNNRIMMTTTME